MYLRALFALTLVGLVVVAAGEDERCEAPAACLSTSKPFCSKVGHCINCNDTNPLACVTNETCGPYLCDSFEGCTYRDMFTSNCTRFGQICDVSKPSNPRCVDCVDDGQCPDSMKPVCNKLNKCVQCTKESIKSTCWRDDRCSTLCLSLLCFEAKDCTASNQVCNQGECADCNSDTQCTDPLFPHCDVKGKGTCFECLGNGHCSSDTSCGPTCNDNSCTSTPPKDCTATATRYCQIPEGDTSASPTCVACLNKTHCPSQTPFCDKGECVECMENKNCPNAGDMCHLGNCVQCTNNSDCATHSACDSVCMPDGKCSKGSLDCTAQRKYCNETSQQCQQCLNDKSCTSKNAPFCHLGVCGSCKNDEGCRNNSHCTAYCDTETHACTSPDPALSCSGLTPNCDLSSGECKGCSVKNFCKAPKPFCLDDTCVECENVKDCKGALKGACVNGKCVECDADLACRSDASCQATCDLTTNTCVKGANPVVCSGDTPTCDKAEGVCKGCSFSNACKSPTPYCDHDKCVACTKSSHCRDIGMNVCFDGKCYECDKDGQCRNENDCSATCNMDDHTCVPSATPAKCVIPSPTCDATTGTCEGCSFKNYCSGKTPACFEDKCVECNDLSDCPRGSKKCFNHQCRPCAKDVDCRSENDCSATCNLATYTCEPSGVKCVVGSKAPSCEKESGKCVECTATECPASKGICSKNKCVECDETHPCFSFSKQCHNNACVECIDDKGCSDASHTTPFCSSQGKCVGCYDDKNCVDSFKGNHCVLGECKCKTDSECRSDSACDATCSFGECHRILPTSCHLSGTCDTEAGKCRECNSDTHCSSFSRCVSRECVFSATRTGSLILIGAAIVLVGAGIGVTVWVVRRRRQTAVAASAVADGLGDYAAVPLSNPTQGGVYRY